LSAWRVKLVGIVEELSCADARVVGSKQVIRFAGTSELRKVYIAKDADEQLTDKLRQMCEKYGIEYDMSCTMHQIGSACNIEVGSACAAIIKQSKKDIPESLGC
jgi:large subunit ribosomal protein L7A